MADYNKQDVIDYLVQVKGATPEDASAYIDSVGLEAAVSAEQLSKPTEEITLPSAEDDIKAMALNLANSASLDNLEKIDSVKQALEKYSQNQPAGTAVGKLAGTLGTFMYPGAQIKALSKVPTFVKAAGAGALYGALTNPKTPKEDELSARARQAGGGALVGASVPTLLNALGSFGKKIYGMPFKKLDAESVIANAENADDIQRGVKQALPVPSETLFKEGMKGSFPKIIGDVKGNLNKGSYPVMENVRGDLAAKYQYNVDDLQKAFSSSLPDETKLTVVGDEIKTTRGLINKMLAEYKPEGWDDKANQFARDAINFRRAQAVNRRNNTLFGINTPVPEKPVKPVKMMSVEDFNKNMTALGKKAEEAFANKTTGESGKVSKEFLADLYKVMSAAEEKAVQEQLGSDVFKSFKTAKKDITDKYKMFPVLKDLAEKEFKTPTITPFEAGAYATAPTMLMKEGLEQVYAPAIATRLGLNIDRLSKTRNPTPQLVKAISPYLLTDEQIANKKAQEDAVIKDILNGN